jgi:putative ABC transport system ATP-binding protein
MSAAALASASATLGLELQRLSLTFADPARPARTVLDVAHWSVPGGAQVAICGPSGSGKTSLLEVLCGLRQPAECGVRWGAIDIDALPDRARSIWRRETVGLVFQQCHLFTGCNALENVLLPLRFAQLAPTQEQRAWALALLARLAIAPRADTSQLSRGEQQRVAVARALVNRPPIVLADEPTASLDPTTGASVAGLMLELCRESSATLIVATHDMALAERMDACFEIRDAGLAERRRRAAVIGLASGA